MTNFNIETINAINAAKAPRPSEKVVSPWLKAAGEIQMKYFGLNPTTLSVREVQDEVMMTYHDLPLREVAVIFTLIASSHAKLQEQMVPA
jgi:hypothetical protein